MESLIIRLGSQATDAVHWLVWSSQENEIIASGMLDDAWQLSSLKERAGQRPITALVPGSDCLLKWVSMPAKASRKALTAIPFMLEEDLSTDIGEQFFALGEKQGLQQAVAVVSHEKMQGWLSLIQDAQLSCDKLLPDVLALPAIDAMWSFLTLGEHAIVRQDDWQGLQGHSQWILPAVEHYAKQQETPLQVANFSQLGLTHLANVESVEQTLDMPMQVLANGALNASFNLLQGEYKAKKQTTAGWKNWYLAASLAALALVITLADKGIELSQLSHKNEQLTQQMHAEFSRAFPNASKPRVVKTSMQNRIASLESSGGSASMLAIMSQLSEAFSNSKIKPQSLRFDSQRSQLSIQAVAEKYEDLEVFKRLAEQKGFDVQQGAVNNRDNQVIGALTVRS